MNDTLAGLLTIGLLLLALAACYVPLGDYMARVFSSSRHLRVEHVIYRATGVDPDGEQSPRAYGTSVIGFSLASVLLLYAILRLQSYLPFSRHLAGVNPATAFNTAVSFATNTNWQSYSGEQTLGFTAQMAGLAVQNFLSAAVGIAVAIALVRGFARTRSETLGSFWVDIVRGTIRILLPLAVAGAIVLVATGVAQNFLSDQTITTLTGQHQTLVQGPVASQESIKELGNNGGGFFNANSAHPFENPNAFSDWLEIFLILLIPVALTRTFGRLVGDKRQGYAILAAMTVIWAVALAAASVAELHHSGTALQAAGGSWEGKETRFGVLNSALFAVSTTGTSTGAVNSAHDSFTAAGGGVPLVNILLGEVAPGGAGAGIYGILAIAVVTVFIGGLMIGRTPEYLGKKIRSTQVTYVALYALATPALVLVGTGVATALHPTRNAVANPGAHGLSEVFYAFASAANNNGSAFAGITVTSNFFQTSLGLAMVFGRFVPILLVIGLAGSLARQGKVPDSAGTLPTHTPLFVGLLVGVIVLLTGLTYFPGLALGPIAEAI